MGPCVLLMGTFCRVCFSVRSSPSLCPPVAPTEVAVGRAEVPGPREEGNDVKLVVKPAEARQESLLSSRVRCCRAARNFLI